MLASPDPALELLRSRVSESHAAVVRRAATSHADCVALVDRWTSSRRPGLLEVCGVGGSELPARLLVTALVDAGLSARFASLSRFAIGDTPLATADARVVFSQSLSPNARLALDASLPNVAHEPAEPVCPSLILVSARDAAPHDPRTHVLVHGPQEESGLLLRVIGPLQACLLAADLASALRGTRPHVPPEAVQAALAFAVQQANALDGAGADSHLTEDHPLVLLTEGIESELGAALALKLVEGLGCEARAGDALGFAHGILQSIYNRRAQVLLLTHEGSPLRARVRAVLAPERHTLLEHHATLPFPYSVLERAAFLDRWVLRNLERHPAAATRLAAWPGQGADGALYHLGASSQDP